MLIVINLSLPLLFVCLPPSLPLFLSLSLPLSLSHSPNELNLEDVINMTVMDLYPRNGPGGHALHHHHPPGSDVSGPNSNLPAKLQYEMSPGHMTQMHITNLQNSPRNSRSSFTMPPNDLTKSIKSLQSFKELFVDRKRISMGHIIMEGEQ